MRTMVCVSVHVSDFTLLELNDPAEQRSRMAMQAKVRVICVSWKFIADPSVAAGSGRRDPRHRPAVHQPGVNSAEDLVHKPGR